MEQSRKFYEEVLGFEPFTGEKESESGEVMYQGRGGTGFMLYESQFSVGEARRLSFATEDFDTEVSALREHGVRLEILSVVQADADIKKMTA